MAIGVEINAEFLVAGTIYNASMSLPTTDLSASSPFLFSVTSQAEGSSATPASLLTLAVGGSELIYVAVAPPANLIAEAGVGDLVKQLDVGVSEGTYDPATHKFTSPTPPPPPPPPPPAPPPPPPPPPPAA